MVKIKLVDMFNIKFEHMENKMNDELAALEKAGHKIKEVKIIGDSLKHAGVFIVYE